MTKKRIATQSLHGNDREWLDSRLRGNDIGKAGMTDLRIICKGIRLRVWILRVVLTAELYL
jgi:hypothetical protein